jgi:uncharacterized protein YecE (DUF72 family)
MIVHIGTSGWSYAWWRELFYPEELPAKEWLPYYAERFKTVEINMTFYRFPRPETLRGWMEKTPSDFTFTLKANKQITHLKRLKNVEHEVHYFYILARSLGKKLGCILFQLPPSVSRDLALLEDFLTTLSPEFRNVIEFRHKSWYDEKVAELMRTHSAIFCTVSSDKVPQEIIETSDIGYLRFHGLTGGHRYNYTDAELREWAERTKKLKAGECYIYFNNDYKAYAVENAQALSEYLEAATP